MTGRLLVAVGLFSCACAWGQDPAAREDAKLERQKILRAADALDALTTQVETMRGEMTALKASNTALRSELDAVKEDNAALKSRLAAQEAVRVKERETLLDEVSRLMAEGGRAKSKPSTDTAAKPKAAAAEPATAKPKAASADTTAAKPRTQKGYDHVVAPGETVYSIAKFYRDQGVTVTSTNICEANGIDRRAPLQAGQKLFIPKATP